MRKAEKTLRTHFSLGRVGCHPSVDFSCSWLTPVLQPVLRQSRRQKEDTWNLFLFVLVAMFCVYMLRVGMTLMSVPPLPQLLSVQSHRLHGNFKNTSLGPAPYLTPASVWEARTQRTKLTANPASDLANASRTQFSEGWAKAHFRECFWPQRWCVLSPKRAVSIYLLCFKFSTTWHIFI